MVTRLKTPLEEIATNLELKKHHTSKGLIDLIREVDREEHLNFILRRVYNPVLLVLSIRDLSGFEVFLGDGGFHRLSDRCAKEISLELRNLVSDGLSELGPLNSDDFVFLSDFVGCFFVH